VLLVPANEIAHGAQLVNFIVGNVVTEAILEGLRQLEHVKAVGAVILDRIVGVIDHHTPQEMGVACSTAAPPPALISGGTPY
jgi:hypothetical protein